MTAGRYTSGKPGSRRERRSRFACGRIVPRLEDGAESFGVTLSPAACQCSVVVHEDIWTIRHGFSFKERIDENEEIAILISLRIEKFVIGTRKLPVVELRAGVTVRRPIRVKSGWQYRGNRGRISSEFDIQEVRGIVPWRRRVECRQSFWRQGIVETF
jgi:hypothetical protein